MLDYNFTNSSISKNFIHIKQGCIYLNILFAYDNTLR